MYTSLTVLAFSSFLAAMPAKSNPSLLADYDLALSKGKTERKPLAVFFGSGQKGYEKVCRDGKWTRKMKETLRKDYIVVYVDTRKKDGRQWAREFGLDKGVVLSDRTTKIQAFRHEGTLSSRDLQKYLVKFADPNLVVRTTETHTSFTAEVYSPPRQPIYSAAPSMGFGRGC
jgi:hypothetical protein